MRTRHNRCSLRSYGIVSIGDLVKSTIGDQKFLIDQLEHYIRGERAIVDG
jgi:hypothetical protein